MVSGCWTGQFKLRGAEGEEEPAPEGWERREAGEPGAGDAENAFSRRGVERCGGS